jgi:hypothetical protein
MGTSNAFAATADAFAAAANTFAAIMVARRAGLG